MNPKKKTHNSITVEEESVPLETKKIVEVTLRGNYLPYLLVKLLGVSVFYNNAEARKHIRTEGVIIDGKITNNIDIELQKGATYIIEINNIIYKVRLS